MLSFTSDPCHHQIGRVKCSRTTRIRAAQPSLPGDSNKQDLVRRLLHAKEKSGKTFSQIASEILCTNLYTAALFYNQHQLKPGGPGTKTEELLIAAVPALKEDGLIEEMKKAPWRRFDPTILQEPALYQFYEFITHNGEAIKAIINEEGGDGIMSAIDIYSSIETVQGKAGEKRIVLKLNGKFLPYVEGLVEMDTS